MTKASLGSLGPSDVRFTQFLWAKYHEHHSVSRNRSGILSHLKFLNPNRRSNVHNHNNIFILVGQSNIEGHGCIVNNTWDGVVPPKSKSNPSIFCLSASLKWEDARVALHADIDVNKTCGVRPAMAFANTILEREGGIGGVGLVPCAVGGTQISEWARGSRFYKDILRRARVFVKGG
ncbi:hypothetical protein LguiA_022157 [Lonicera macranthoides]